MRLSNACSLPRTGRSTCSTRAIPAWRCAYRTAVGEPSSISTGTAAGFAACRSGRSPAISLAEARDAWRSAREDVAKDIDPSIALKRERPATDFKNVTDEWLRRDQAKNRSHDNVKRIIDKNVIPAWGHRSIVDIGRRDVLDLIDGVVDRGAVSMARQVHAHLHRLFRWCVGRGIIEANPMADLPKPGQATKRERVLSDDELKAVWNGAVQMGWPFGPVVQLLILTGARRSEIGGLRWSEIQKVKSVCPATGQRTPRLTPSRSASPRSPSSKACRASPTATSFSQPTARRR